MPEQINIWFYYRRLMYDGKEGFLYQPVSCISLKNTKGHTWECATDVPVIMKEHVLNVFEEILHEEKMGNVIIHRYSETDPLELKRCANAIRDELDDPIYAECRDFLYKHFSPLWD